MNISELRLQFIGWESQWSRVQRHAVRIQQAVQGDPTADAWDDVINFFIHTFSLLDWLESDGLITTAKKRQLLAQAPLSVSRDIANAAKHRHLNRPSHPGGIALVREYAPERNREEEWVVIGAGPKTTIGDLATSVMQELETLVREVRVVGR